jgi:predicted ATPase
MIHSHFLRTLSLRQDDVGDGNRFPFGLPAIRSLASRQLDFHPKVTFFVGENGSGKSTLLEALAIHLGFNAEGGTKNFRFHTRASHSDLHRYLKVGKGLPFPKDGFFLRAESFFNVATEIEALDAAPSFGPPVINSYGRRSLHEQSHGESFMALVANRFGGNGIYLLDEPEAALSPQRQLQLLAHIHKLVKKRSQFVIATHSPILMAYPDADIVLFTQDGLDKVSYIDTEHFQVTHDFLVNPARMLKVLLGD